MDGKRKKGKKRKWGYFDYEPFDKADSRAAIIEMYSECCSAPVETVALTARALWLLSLCTRRFGPFAVEEDLIPLVLDLRLGGLYRAAFSEDRREYPAQIYHQTGPSFLHDIDDAFACYRKMICIGVEFIRQSSPLDDQLDFLNACLKECSLPPLGRGEKDTEKRQTLYERLQEISERDDRALRMRQEAYRKKKD